MGTFVQSTTLILWIKKQGWYPYLDYALRSEEEQQRLYGLGLSKCDGITRVSRHQYGKVDGFAVDIYISKDGIRIFEEELYVKAHKYWESLGGRPMIEWDKAHFEV